MARSSTQSAHTAWDSDRHCISPTDMTLRIHLSVCVCAFLPLLRVVVAFLNPDRAVVKVNVRRCHVATFMKLRH